MVFATVAGSLAVMLATLGHAAHAKPDGFLAEPKSGHGRGVLVLHAWWGLNEDVKAFCNRLADSGFVAFAPDLFHGRLAKTRAEAEALVNEYDPKHLEVEAQIDEAAKYLDGITGKHGIAVVGFSFGAYFALFLSNAEPEIVRAAVVYYGTGHEDFSKSRAAYLGHFAENDEFEPKAGVDHLTKLLHDAGRPATIYTYPRTGHWFVEPSVTQAYNKDAAELAWDRTLEFLRANLKGG